MMIRLCDWACNLLLSRLASGHRTPSDEGASSNSTVGDPGAFAPVRVVFTAKSSQPQHVGFVSGVRQKVHSL